MLISRNQNSILCYKGFKKIKILIKCEFKCSSALQFSLSPHDPWGQVTAPQETLQHLHIGLCNTSNQCPLYAPTASGDNGGRKFLPFHRYFGVQWLKCLGTPALVNSVCCLIHFVLKHIYIEFVRVYCMSLSTD